MRMCYLWNELYVIRFQDLTCYAASTKTKSALLPDTSCACGTCLYDVQWSQTACEVSSNARSERNHPAASPNSAPATQKGMSWLILLSYETSFTMRGARGISLQPHQILRVPRKMNLMIDPHHICNVIYNARSNRQHPPTSPNTAPATQNECHDWATSQMKRHLQCAEQQATPSNLTKYCACHA